MVPTALGVSSAADLDGATVCVQTGTTTELNLADFFADNGISYTPYVVTTAAETNEAYLAGLCDVYTTDASGLAANRTTFPDPSAHVILPEIVSKEPLGPVTRQGDEVWGDIVRWTLNAMIIAEELGITSDNAAAMAADADDCWVKVCWVLKVAGACSAWLTMRSQRHLSGCTTWSFERNVGPDRSWSGPRSERSVDRWRHPVRSTVPLRTSQALTC